ncbi:hypothetical protein CGZ69_04500 [Streptomyces peucetius subsp. caesius ATCC 27952]|nr:hypothetical protein CGZ69_04500 [Streptomyces peucetius subsp. caesius ATCC 27952]
MKDLNGKIALVTGGARNVGKAIATKLAERGAHVLINYFHSHEQAKQTQEELRALGVEVDLLRASVARPEQVAKMFAEIERRFGRLDILVNNARRRRAGARPRGHRQPSRQGPRHQPQGRSALRPRPPHR